MNAMTPEEILAAMKLDKKIAQHGAVGKFDKTVKKQKEADIKKAIMQFLAAINCFAFPITQVGIYKKKTDSYITLSTKGISDIIGIYKGKPLALEGKTKIGKLSLNQKTFLLNYIEAGGIGGVVRSVEDTINILAIYDNEKSWQGILLKKVQEEKVR